MHWRGKGLLLIALALLVGCATPQIRLNSGDMVMEVKSKVPVIGAVDFAPDGKSVISGGWDPVARQWDLTGAREVRKFGDTHQGFIESVAFSPDGHTVAISTTGVTNFSNSNLTLWDVATGRLTRQIDAIGGRIQFSHDGKALIGNTSGFSAGTVKLADVQTGTITKEFDGAYSGVISPDGKYLLQQLGKEIVLTDWSTHREMWRVPRGGLSFFAYLPDGTSIVAAKNDKAGHGDLRTSLVLLDSATGRQLKEFGRESYPGGFFSIEWVYHQLGAVAVSPDGRFAISGDLGGRYRLWDIARATEVRPLKLVNELVGTMLNSAPSVAFSPNGRTAVVSSLASTRLFDVATGDELGTMIAFEDGEWLVITPNGYYNSSEKGDQYMSVAVSGQPYSIAQFRESFFRPDLVGVALAGGSLREFRKIAEIKPPPAISIINTPASIAGQDVTVTLRIEDAGGGIGDIRLYLNGTSVLLDNNRGVAVVPLPTGREVIKKYAVKLTTGPNTIRAIAFNGDNSLQSSDARQEITSSYQAAGRPSLHALVIGINEAKNPRLQLNYAVADAEIFAATLQRAAAPLFDKVNVRRLLKPEETTQENIMKELRAYRGLNPDDLFVFYVASHGTVDDGEYFLITSNVGSTSTARLKADAISQNSLKETLANIPATKKLIVIDTCSAGKLGDALQTAMLTRGMSEDTAMKVLSRAVGSTILSASTSVQEALEGYQGHGLFTYVLTEGLSGKADKGKSGFIKTTELADYVDNEVPVLAERIFKRAQYPIISISGQAFPIGKVQ